MGCKSEHLETDHHPKKLHELEKELWSVQEICEFIDETTIRAQTPVSTACMQQMSMHVWTSALSA